MDNDAGLSDWSITVLPTIPLGPFYIDAQKEPFLTYLSLGNLSALISRKIWVAQKFRRSCEKLATLSINYVHQLSLSKWFLLVFSDSLIDCQDPDCCSHPKCVNNHLCYTVEDPVNIARNKSLLDFTMNFWERIQFLVSDAGIQRYAQINHFDPL